LPFTGRILNVSVFISTPFNGSGFGVDIGTNIIPNVLIPNSEIDLAFLENNYKISNIYIVEETIQATINIGIGTLGTGNFVIEFSL
jgi:hypothetical protein